MKSIKTQSIVKLLRYTFIVGAVLILVFITWKNFSPLGEQVIEYNFETKTPFIQSILPLTRVEKIKCEKEIGCYQEIFNDPTYLEILMPRKFKTVTIQIQYQTDNDFPLKIGMQLYKNWGYDSKTSNIISEENGWLTSEVEFDLEKTYIEKRKASFAISMEPIKDNEETMRIRDMRFKFERITFASRVLDSMRDGTFFEKLWQRIIT